VQTHHPQGQGRRTSDHRGKTSRNRPGRSNQIQIDVEYDVPIDFPRLSLHVGTSTIHNRQTQSSEESADCPVHQSRSSRTARIASREEFQASSMPMGNEKCRSRKPSPLPAAGGFRTTKPVLRRHAFGKIGFPRAPFAGGRKKKKKKTEKRARLGERGRGKENAQTRVVCCYTATSRVVLCSTQTLLSVPYRRGVFFF